MKTFTVIVEKDFDTKLYVGYVPGFPGAPIFPTLLRKIAIELKKTAPWSPSRLFDSEAILGVLSINPSELELVRQQTHFHTYYDHKRKLKIGISCQDEGAPLSVSFSSKYYKA